MKFRLSIEIDEATIKAKEVNTEISNILNTFAEGFLDDMEVADLKGGDTGRFYFSNGDDAGEWEMES